MLEKRYRTGKEEEPKLSRAESFIAEAYASYNRWKFNLTGTTANTSKL
jgi:hypothetical protein